MLVSEITQITAHEWNVVNGYKKICYCITIRSSRALLESKRHPLPSSDQPIIIWYDSFENYVYENLTKVGEYDQSKGVAFLEQ